MFASEPRDRKSQNTKVAFEKWCNTLVGKQQYVARLPSRVSTEQHAGLHGNLDTISSGKLYTTVRYEQGYLYELRT